MGIARTTRVLLAATAMTLACGFVAAPAFARTNHAVLVAVTAYPNLSPKASLIGPNHDAGLVRDYLTTAAPVPFKPEDVTLLADGVEGATSSPTHEHILAALTNVAAKAERGDFVYLHFSGHGAQQPETRAGTETDGLDEIFLPADTAKWVDKGKGVPNALMDDEIGGALDAIRAKGAFVWVIFDACHSGSATRAAEVEDVTERKLGAEDLGIPQAAMAEAEAEAEKKPGEREAAFTLTDEPVAAGDDATRDVALGEETPTGAESIAKGGMVAFFAAQTIETTPEMPLPKGATDAPKFGLFTYTIMSKLAANPNMTYRQLGNAVLQQYAADSRERPTPLFEGELDARVFGMEKLDQIMQWPIEVKGDSASVSAGLLHRLAKGTKLAILPNPAAEPKDAVGYLEVKSAKNLTSQVVPVAFDGKPALNLSELPANAYARLTEVTVDYRLKVARPAPTEGLADEVALVNRTLDALAAAKDTHFNVELVDSGKEADIRLAVLRENQIAGADKAASDKPALWFLPSSGDITLDNGKRPPLVAIDTADADKLAKGASANLLKIFRASSLSRLAAASDYAPEQVSVKFLIKRDGKDEMEPLDGTAVPIVNPGDQVHIAAQNLSNKLIDINILYVGSDYSITHMDSQRLVSGAKVEEGLLAFTDKSFGMERMIAVLTEAPPLSEIENLKFLEQEGVPAATRGLGSASFSDMLTDIGMAPATRSAMKLEDKSGPKGGVLIFPIETQPKS